MLDAKLVIVGGANLAQVYALKLPATMGRGEKTRSRLPTPWSVAGIVRLFEQGGLLWVRDLGSLNGTFVGNQPVEGVTSIEPGQLLTIGTVTFRAIYNGFEVDSDDEADAVEEAQLVGESEMAPCGPEDRAGLTMTRPATSLAAETVDSASPKPTPGSAPKQRHQPSKRPSACRQRTDMPPHRRRSR